MGSMSRASLQRGADGRRGVVKRLQTPQRADEGSRRAVAGIGVEPASRLFLEVSLRVLRGCTQRPR